MDFEEFNYCTTCPVAGLENPLTLNPGYDRAKTLDVIN